MPATSQDRASAPMACRRAPTASVSASAGSGARTVIAHRVRATRLPRSDWEARRASRTGPPTSAGRLLSSRPVSTEPGCLLVTRTGSVRLTANTAMHEA
jgi:hypothetical protein